MRRAAVVSILALVAAACATGDGTELTPPPPGATAPPTTTPDTVVETAAPDVEEATVAPGFDTATLPSAPLETQVPPSPLGAGVTVSIPGDADPSTFAVFAPWEDGGPYDPTYTCEGLDVSPPLAWTGLPRRAEEVAVTLIDETSVQFGQPFVHWVLAGIATSTTGLDEAFPPEGSYSGINYYGTVGYNGPCPPPGERHDYVITVHALEQPLGLAEGVPADEMIDAIEKVTIRTAVVVGSYER